LADIILRGVTKRFPDGNEVVHAIDLEIADGELMILVGPSGCGKTTTLRMIAGLEEISAGQLLIDGTVINEVTPKDRDIAMVFQTYALYPHMTVYKNMAFPLKRAGLKSDEIARRVEEAAHLLGVTELLNRKPGTLSGGQRQRVAMGRAIVREPKAFLMDEPLSNLDAKLRVQMRAEITRIQRSLGTTMVYVTHDQTEAMTLGDRLAVMRDGSIQQLGTPRELYDRPRNLFVAGFIGSPAMNFLNGEIEDGVVRTPLTPIPLDGELGARLDGYERGRRLIVGIRPEDFEDAALVRETDRGHTLIATIDVLEQTGSDVYAYLTLDSGAEALHPSLAGEEDGDGEGVASPDFIARLSSTTSLDEGEEGKLWLDTSNVHVFDPETGERIEADATATSSSAPTTG
jgi:multiple sugar transport system ATP-binding protein